MVELIDLSKLNYNEVVPENALGVWRIPKLDIRVPVYSDKLRPGNTQSITDDPKSACQQRYYTAYMISDHSGAEGTWYMEKVTLGTQAFYIKKNEIVAYSCYELCIADYHTWGYTIHGGVVLPKSSRDILCVSCVDATGKQAYIAIFKELGRV